VQITASHGFTGAVSSAAMAWRLPGVVVVVFIPDFIAPEQAGG